MNGVRFSLRRLIGAVVIVAIACALARYSREKVGFWGLYPTLGVASAGALGILLYRGKRRGLLTSCSVGLAIGWALDLLGVALTGAGHGTWWPFFLFFGPLFPFWGKSELLFEVLVACAPILYGVYGTLLRVAAARHRARLCLLCLLLLHYGGVSATVERHRWVHDVDMTEVTYLKRIWRYYPEWLVASGLVFVSAHILAVWQCRTAKHLLVSGESFPGQN